MILAADPHPVATYLAGCLCLAAMLALSVQIICRDVGRNWPRIRNLLLGRAEARPVAAKNIAGEPA